MATQRPANRTGGGNSRNGNSLPDGGGNNVRSSSADYAALKLLARILVYVAVAVFVVTSFLANIETQWMKAEIKQEAKELRRLHTDVEQLLKKARDEKATTRPDGGDGAGGL